MLIIHISWHFHIFLLCECGVNDISYRQRDAMRKPELQWLRPFRPAWIATELGHALHAWKDPHKLAAPLSHHLNRLTTEERCRPWGMHLPQQRSSLWFLWRILLAFVLCKDAAPARMRTAWLPSSPCFSAFGYAGNHDLGQSWESNDGVRFSWGSLFNLASPGTPPLVHHVSAFSWGSRGLVRQKHAKMVPFSALSQAAIWQPSVMETWCIWNTLLSNHLGSHCKAFHRFENIHYQIKVWHRFLSEKQSKTWVRAPVLDMTVVINQTTYEFFVPHKRGS